MERTQLWIVAYDSPSDQRRRKLSDLLQGFGQRLQWSVFECRLREDQLRALRWQLERRIDAGQDRVCLWPVAGQQVASIVTIGLPPPEADPVDYIL
ncbi:MAG: CRISPR-associated endonuclease Cas2 [Cyanobacteriota bacterium]